MERGCSSCPLHSIPALLIPLLVPWSGWLLLNVFDLNDNNCRFTVGYTTNLKIVLLNSFLISSLHSGSIAVWGCSLVHEDLTLTHIPAFLWTEITFEISSRTSCESSGPRLSIVVTPIINKTDRIYSLASLRLFTCFSGWGAYVPRCARSCVTSDIPQLAACITASSLTWFVLWLITLLHECKWQ